MTCPEIRCVLPGTGEEIYLRNITTSQQKSIVKAYEKQDIILLEQIFDWLLKECVISETFDPLTLYNKDRQFLLMQLRLESVKGSYCIHTQCPWCDKKRELEYELDEFNFSDIISPVEEYTLKFNDNVSVVVGYITRQNDLEINQYIRALGGVTDSGEIDKNMTEFTYALGASCVRKVLVTCNGKVIEETPNFEEKLEFLSELSTTDSELLIDNVIEKNKIGDISFEIDCNNDECAYVYKDTEDWNTFFYKMMSGDINFEIIFNEIGTLCFSEQIGFIKKDVDNMPPFERQAYIDLFSGLMKEQERNMKQPENTNNTQTTSNPFSG